MVREGNDAEELRGESIEEQSVFKRSGTEHTVHSLAAEARGRRNRACNCGGVLEVVSRQPREAAERSNRRGTQRALVAGEEGILVRRSACRAARVGREL